jgi:hypothetical protein
LWRSCRKVFGAIRTPADRGHTYGRQHDSADRASPGNFFWFFLFFPQGSHIVHSFFTTVRVFILARRNEVAESVRSET